jgi:hypothetical protein
MDSCQRRKIESPLKHKLVQYLKQQQLHDMEEVLQVKLPLKVTDGHSSREADPLTMPWLSLVTLPSKAKQLSE